MFYRRSIFALIFGLLLLFGLSSAWQRSNFNAGYNVGYAAAQQAGSATGETAGEAPAPPAAPAGPRWGWGFFPVFGFFGLLFKFWLFLMLFGVFFKVFGRVRRRSYHDAWHRHKPPPYEKQPEDVDPTIQHM